MEAELREDFSKELINTLCVRNENDGVQLKCFLSAGSLLKFANEFQVVSGQKYGSDLFMDLWRNAVLQATTQNPELTLDDIFPLVWQPCIQQCKQLLKSLMDLSMKLSDVNIVLEPHMARLETQLQSLFKGINEITQSSVNSLLIDKAVLRVRDYWNLCQYQKGADIFLGLKTSLKLAGDFHLVERLSQQVWLKIHHKANGT